MKLINRIKNKMSRGSRVLSFYMAIGSMLLNMTTPFLLSYSYVAYAEDTSVPVSEETTVVEEPQTSEPAVTTDEQNAVVDGTPTEEVVTEEPVVENPVLESGTEPEINPVVEPTSEPQGDILEDGVSDYRPEEGVEAVLPVTDTSDSSDPIVEVIENTGIKETEKIEQECLIDGQEISDTTNDNWNIDSENGYAETKENVKPGVKYIFPEDEGVSLTFKCLPKNDADKSILKIQKVKVEDLRLPEEFKTDAEYAYDITTNMADASFEYDLTLPKPEGTDAKVSYIEKSLEEATSTGVKVDEVMDVEESKVEQKSEESDVKVGDLDHFTIFIVITAGNAPTLSSGAVNNQTQVTVTPNAVITVTLKATTSGSGNADDWRSSQYKIGDGSWNCVDTGNHNGDETYTESFNINAPANPGAYNLSLNVYNGNNCSGGSGNEYVMANAITVTAPVANPALSQACGLDIALVLDNSTSIDSSELTIMKNAMTAFTNALNGTPTWFSVTKFGTTASVVRSFTSNISDVNTAINSITVPGGTNYTNWQDAFIKTRSTFDPRSDKPNLIIFASDGNPNRTGASGTSVDEAIAVANAVVVSNAIKTDGTRILGLGIGIDLNTDNMVAITGPHVNTGSVLTSDLITTNFAGLAAELSNFAKQTCGGKISVNKYVDEVQKSDGQTWSFKIDGTTTITTDGNGQVVSGTLSVGNHNISEVSIPTGYSFDRVTCTSGVPDPTNKGFKDIAVTADSIITCNFYNTTNRGSITLIKNTVGGNGTFDFTTTGGLSPASSSITTIGNTGSQTFSNIMPGTYSISETVPAGWGLTSATCDDGSQVNVISLQPGENITCTFNNTKDSADLSIVKTADKATYIPGDTVTYTLTITNNGPKSATGVALTDNVPVGLTYVSAAPSQGTCNQSAGTVNCDLGTIAYLGSATVTVTATVNTGTNGDIVNTGSVSSSTPDSNTGNNSDNETITIQGKGTLIVRKIVTNDNGGNKVYTDFSFSVNGGGATVFEAGGQNEMLVDIGNYTITEPAVVGYTTSYNNCDSINVPAGGSATCTITNDDIASTLKLVKSVTNDNGGISTTHDWDLTATGTDLGFTDKGDSTTFHTIKAGVDYTLSESTIAGYQAGTWTCDGGTQLGDHITLGLNQNVTCTIINNDQHGRIIIKKQTNPDSDQTYFQFTGEINETIADGGSKEKIVIPGGYYVDETVPSGWVLTSIICDDANSGANPTTANRANINIEANETVTCVFTNTKIPTLTVTKIIDPSNDQGLFNLFIDGVGVATDVGHNFTSNPLQVDIGFQHQVSETAGTETNLVDYVVTYGGDCNAQGQIILSAGENKNCTITNTLKRGSISGIKFEDKNGNHEKDGDELGLSGWTIYIDSNKNNQLDSGEPTQITNPLGNFTFNNLLPGNYWVKEVSQTGWSQTRPTFDYQEVDLTAGENEFIYFGNRRNPATVVAYKIVCTDEADLPNWGTGGPNITSTTAQDWVNSHSSCRFESGWDFQWGYSNAPNPGDNTGESSDPKWFTFNQPTDSNGMTSVIINDLQSTPHLWLREVWKSDYIPFTYGTEGESNRNNISAEMYCHIDVLNFDNWDRVDGVQYGNTYYCIAWNVLNYGNVVVNKFQDNDNDGFKDETEPLLSGWNITLGQYTQVTNENGRTTFANLTPGTYGMIEPAIPTGWVQTNMYCDNEASGVVDNSNQHNVTVGLGQVVNCYIGNIQLGDIHGYKWNDFNGDGAKDSNEGFLGNWRIFIDGNNNQTYNPGERATLTENFGQDHGWYWFTGLIPGSYSVCEELQTGWVQTYPNTICQTVTLPYDSSLTERFVLNAVYAPDYNFGNRMVNPILHISKENDTGGITQLIGNLVKYTIKIWVTDSELHDVRVADLLPKGFKYVTGSWRAYDYNNDPMSIGEPHYASPGAWEIGNLEPEKPVTLEYTAEIQYEVDAGIYKDLAWTAGTDLLDRSTLGLADALGYVDTNFVGTQVKVDVENEPEKAKVDIKVNEEVEEVLGASTSRLPATGINPFIIWAILSASTLGGLLFILGGIAKLIKKRKGFPSILAILIFGILSMGQARADTPNLIVRIEDPKSPVMESFKITFVVMDLVGGRNISYECYNNTPADANYNVFQSGVITTSGGDTANCEVGDAVLDDDGSYAFYVKVITGLDEAVSDKVLVNYDSQGPGKPKYIEKDKKSSCKNEITFRTSDDGGETSYVEVYKSTDKEFTAKDSNRVETINVGSDEKYSFIDEFYGGDCGKTYYYGVRAFDSSGNASKVRSEEITETTTKTIEGEITEEVTQGAIPSGGQILGAGGSAEGAKVVLEGTETGSAEGGGTILGGETTEAAQGGLGGVLKAILAKWWLWLGLIAIIFIIANAAKQKRNEK